MEKLKGYKDFKKKTLIPGSSNFTTYDLNYDKGDANNSLRSLEDLGEGEFRIGDLLITRTYINSGSFPQDQKIGLGDKFTFYMKIENLVKEPFAQMGFVHGFSESSESYFEIAIMCALNGILCHLIDLECFGFSAGIKGPGLRIENMHLNITALIN